MDWRKVINAHTYDVDHVFFCYNSILQVLFLYNLMQQNNVKSYSAQGFSKAILAHPEK